VTYGWDFKNGEFIGLLVGTKVVRTKLLYIGHVGRVVSLHSDGRVTFIFPCFSSHEKTYSVEDCKSKWGIAVIPADTSLSKNMSIEEASKFVNPRNQYVRITDEQIERNKRIRPLLTFFRGYVNVINIILDYEGTKVRFSRLGWMRLDGEYLGLEKNTKVVATLRPYMGHIGFVDKIYENDPQGKMRIYFRNMRHKVISADAALKILGLCVVPDDTDMNKIMPEYKVRNYIRVRDHEWLGSLGWVFESGKYKGLQINSKVVYTKSHYIGCVGRVDEIQENCMEGTVKYFFPTSRRITPRYTADAAMELWGLCVVPDYTDINTILTEAKARSYLRVRPVSKE